jgi:pimeloyl-ACP methyl ester carboxylesterase
MRYLCTGILPDGSIRRPHEYGAAVILAGAAPKLVPPSEVDPLEKSVIAWLNASSVASNDATAATALFADVRAQSAKLAEPARTLMADLDADDLAALGPALLPYVDALGSDPALSPDRSPITTAPVFLLHGRDDNVIPPSEMPFLAEDLRARGNAHVTTLLTPILTHATLQPHVGAADTWALVRFWREVFATAVLP